MRAYPVMLLLALGGCPLLEVDANVQEACVTRNAVAVAANAPSGAQDIVVDQLDSLATLANQGFHLSLVHGAVTATSGITDFSFVSSAQVTVASGDPSSTLPTLTAFGCDGCTASGATLELVPDGSDDISPYVSTGSLVLGVALAGPPPAVDWTMDVTVCASGSASYRAGL